MSNRAADFEKFGIRVTRDKRYVWMRCLKATAAFYGWDKAFPRLVDLKKQTTGSRFLHDTGRRGLYAPGGVQHVICRSPIKQGSPRGLTNAFVVSSNATNQDLALIAKSTQVDWHWMTGKFGERLDRGWWEETAAA